MAGGDVTLVLLLGSNLFIKRPVEKTGTVELLKFDLVSGLEAESFAGEPIGGGVESPHRGEKLFGLIPIGQHRPWHRRCPASFGGV